MEELYENQETSHQSSEKVAVEIPISDRAVGLMRAYAAFTGLSSGEVSVKLGESIGELVESKLWDLAREAMGERPGMPEQVVISQTVDTTMALAELNRLADLGDTDNDDDDGTMNPKRNWTTETSYHDPANLEAFESSPSSVSSGLTDADLENDLIVDDPEHEAVSEADPFEINNEADMLRVLGAADAYLARVGINRNTPPAPTRRVSAAKNPPQKTSSKQIKSVGRTPPTDFRAKNRKKTLSGFKGKVTKFDGNESSPAAEL